MPLPEELRGKPPEEVYDLLKEEHVREVEDIKNDLISKIPKVQEPPPQTFQPIPQTVQQTTEDANFYQDPGAFVQREVAKAVAGLIGSYSTSQRPTNEKVFAQSLEDEDRELYVKYQAEINAKLDMLPIDKQADPNAYKLAYELVTGAHRKEIEKDRFEKEAEKLVKDTLRDKVGMDEEAIEKAFRKEVPPQKTSFFQPSIGAVNVPQPRHLGASGKKSPKLDDIAKAVARGFGISEDEYSKAFFEGEGNE